MRVWRHLNLRCMSLAHRRHRRGQPALVDGFMDHAEEPSTLRLHPHLHLHRALVRAPTGYVPLKCCLPLELALPLKLISQPLVALPLLLPLLLMQTLVLSWPARLGVKRVLQRRLSACQCRWPWRFPAIMRHVRWPAYCP